MNQVLDSGDRRLLVLVLGALTCLGPMAIDLYLPALPAIAQSMGEPLGRIQLTISSYTIGFALAQIVFGPLSDRFGRLKVMVPGLLAFIVTNYLASLAETADELIIIRVFQAMSGACVMVTIPAIVRDLFPRQECAKVLSMVLLVMTIAPLLAPIIGGQLLKVFGWNSLFVFLAGFGVLAVILAITSLKESLPEDRRISMRPQELVAAYKGILTHRNAMGYILCHAFFFAGMFAFVSGSPFVYIEMYGVPADQYGFLFALNIVGMAACNMINMRLMERFPLEKLLRFGSVLSMVAGLALVFNAWTGFGGLAGIVIPVVVFESCMGFTGPNSNALALSYFPRTAGTANGTAGVIRFSLGGISAGLAGLLHNGTAIPMAAIICACGVLSVLSLMIVRPECETALEDNAPEQVSVDSMPDKKAA